MPPLSKLAEPLFERKSTKFLLVAIFSMPFLIILFYRLKLIWFYDADIGGYEYELFYEIRRFLSEGFIYSSPTAPPFLLVQKTPLYSYLIGTFCSILHLDIDQDPIKLYYLSRVISFSFQALMLYFIYLMGKQVFKLPSWTALILVMISFCLLTRNHFSRMDALYSLIYILICWKFLTLQENKPFQLLLLACLGAILPFVKQNGVLLPIFLAVFLFFSKSFNPKQVLIYYVLPGSLLGLLGLTSIFWIEKILTWDVLYENLVLGLRSGRNYNNLWNIIFGNSHGPLLWVISALLFYFSQTVLCLSNEARRVYFLLSFQLIISILLRTNEGAGLNYLYEIEVLGYAFLLALAFSNTFTFKVQRKINFALTVILIASAALLGKVLEYQRNFKIKEFDDNRMLYNQSLEIKKLLIDRGLKLEEYVYYVGLESFFNDFLFDNILIPQKIALESIYRHDSTTLEMSQFIDGRNKGLIRFLLTDKPINEVRDICFEITYQSFKQINQIGPYYIYEFSASTK